MTGWFRFDIDEARARLASRRGTALSRAVGTPCDTWLAGDRATADCPNLCNNCETTISLPSDSILKAGLSRLSQLSRGYPCKGAIGALRAQGGSEPVPVQNCRPGPCKTGLAPTARALPDPDAFEERAAIMEFDGHLDRDEAECLAAAEQGAGSTSVRQRSEG